MSCMQLDPEKDSTASRARDGCLDRRRKSRVAVLKGTRIDKTMTEDRQSSLQHNHGILNRPKPTVLMAAHPLIAVAE